MVKLFQGITRYNLRKCFIEDYGEEASFCSKISIIGNNLPREWQQ